jgi:putative peptidoglycan lipid II flippase
MFMRNPSLLRSTGIIALSTLASRVLGFARDMIVAGLFGATGTLDGFFVAFRIPNLLRRLVAEGALTVSFIPVYTEYLVARGEREALELAQKTLSILLLVLCAMVALGVVFSPEIVRVLAWGFSDARVIALTVDLTRIMFPYLLLVGLVAFAMGVLNSHRCFFASAFSPVLLNAGMITGALVLSGLFTEPLEGLAWGVVLGGALQAILQIPYLARTGFRMRFSIDLAHPGMRKIFGMVFAAAFGTAVYQVNILMSTFLASLLAPGSISYLYYSDRLTEMVLGIFIAAIGSAVLPEMSRITAVDDTGNLKKLYARAACASLFLAIPAAAGLMAAGTAIVPVLFMHGQFTAFHAEMTARALFCASLGIVPVALLRITTPVFYSLKDARTPVLAASAAFVLNIGLGYALMHTELRHAGLALANSLAAALQAGILLGLLGRRIDGMPWREMLIPAARFLAAASGMVLLVRGLYGLADWYADPLGRRVLILALVVSAGGAVYFALCAMLGVREVRFLWSSFLACAGRAKRRN